MSNQITKSIIVSGQVADLYNLWANFENFPHFMQNVKSVTKTGDRTSHWIMEGPMHTTLEWDAETTRLETNKRIAWSSKDDNGDLTTSGQVTFTGLPHEQTEVTVTVQYVPSKGLVSEGATRLFGDLEEQLEQDLRNFKAYAEGMTERISTGK